MFGEGASFFSSAHVSSSRKSLVTVMLMLCFNLNQKLYIIYLVYKKALLHKISCGKPMKPLRVSDDAHQKLTAMLGEITAQTMRIQTYTDAIENLLSTSVNLPPPRTPQRNPNLYRKQPQSRLHQSRRIHPRRHPHATQIQKIPIHLPRNPHRRLRTNAASTPRLRLRLLERRGLYQPPNTHPTHKIPRNAQRERNIRT